MKDLRYSIIKLDMAFLRIDLRYILGSSYLIFLLLEIYTFKLNLLTTCHESIF